MVPYRFNNKLLLGQGCDFGKEPNIQPFQSHHRSISTLYIPGGLATMGIIFQGIRLILIRNCIFWYQQNHFADSKTTFNTDHSSLRNTFLDEQPSQGNKEIWHGPKYEKSHFFVHLTFPALFLYIADFKQ